MLFLCLKTAFLIEVSYQSFLNLFGPNECPQDDNKLKKKSLEGASIKHSFIIYCRSMFTGLLVPSKS